MGMLVAYLLGILTAINSKDHNRARVPRVSNSNKSQPFPQGPLSVVCVPRTLTDREQAEKKKNKGRKAISFWVRIASLVLLAIYAGVTILIWCVTKKAGETATKELELSQRPCISLENFSIDSPLTFD